jgi:hypothetical protein
MDRSKERPQAIFQIGLNYELPVLKEQLGEIAKMIWLQGKSE